MKIMCKFSEEMERNATCVTNPPLAKQDVE